MMTSKYADFNPDFLLNMLIITCIFYYSLISGKLAIELTSDVSSKARSSIFPSK